MPLKYPTTSKTLLDKIASGDEISWNDFYEKFQSEWISVIVKPLNPPEWFIKQNGKSGLATLFGTEIE